MTPMQIKCISIVSNSIPVTRIRVSVEKWQAFQPQVGCFESLSNQSDVLRPLENRYDLHTMLNYYSPHLRPKLHGHLDPIYFLRGVYTGSNPGLLAFTQDRIHLDFVNS